LECIFVQNNIELRSRSPELDPNMNFFYYNLYYFIFFIHLSDCEKCKVLNTIDQMVLCATRMFYRTGVYIHLWSIIIVQINGQCILSQCLSMPVSLTAPDGAVELLLDAVLPDTLYVLMDVFDVFLLASSLCTAVLPHDFCSAGSKGESLTYASTRL